MSILERLELFLDTHEDALRRCVATGIVVLIAPHVGLLRLVAASWLLLVLVDY